MVKVTHPTAPTTPTTPVTRFGRGGNTKASPAKEAVDPILFQPTLSNNDSVKAESDGIARDAITTAVLHDEIKTPPAFVDDVTPPTSNTSLGNKPKTSRFSMTHERNPLPLTHAYYHERGVISPLTVGSAQEFVTTADRKTDERHVHFDLSAIRTANQTDTTNDPVSPPLSVALSTSSPPNDPQLEWDELEPFLKYQNVNLVSPPSTTTNLFGPDVNSFGLPPSPPLSPVKSARVAQDMLQNHNNLNASERTDNEARKLSFSTRKGRLVSRDNRRRKQMLRDPCNQAHHDALKVVTVILKGEPGPPVCNTESTQACFEAIRRYALLRVKASKLEAQLATVHQQWQDFAQEWRAMNKGITNPEPQEKVERREDVDWHLLEMTKSNTLDGGPFFQEEDDEEANHQRHTSSTNLANKQPEEIAESMKCLYEEMKHQSREIRRLLNGQQVPSVSAGTSVDLGDEGGSIELHAGQTAELQKLQEELALLKWRCGGMSWAPQQPQQQKNWLPQQSQVSCPSPLSAPMFEPSAETESSRAKSLSVDSLGSLSLPSFEASNATASQALETASQIQSTGTEQDRQKWSEMMDHVIDLVVRIAQQEKSQQQNPVTNYDIIGPSTDWTSFSSDLFIPSTDGATRSARTRVKGGVREQFQFVTFPPFIDTEEKVILVNQRNVVTKRRDLEDPLFSGDEAVTFDDFDFIEELKLVPSVASCDTNEVYTSGDDDEDHDDESSRLVNEGSSSEHLSSKSIDRINFDADIVPYTTSLEAQLQERRSPDLEGSFTCGILDDTSDLVTANVPATFALNEVEINEEIFDWTTTTQATGRAAAAVSFPLLQPRRLQLATRFWKFHSDDCLPPVIPYSRGTSPEPQIKGTHNDREGPTHLISQSHVPTRRVTLNGQKQEATKPDSKYIQDQTNGPDDEQLKEIRDGKYSSLFVRKNHRRLMSCPTLDTKYTQLYMEIGGIVSLSCREIRLSHSDGDAYVCVLPEARHTQPVPKKNREITGNICQGDSGVLAMASEVTFEIQALATEQKLQEENPATDPVHQKLMEMRKERDESLARATKMSVDLAACRAEIDELKAALIWNQLELTSCKSQVHGVTMDNSPKGVRRTSGAAIRSLLTLAPSSTSPNSLDI